MNLCIEKQYVFFSNKCSTRALFILFSLSGFWDQRKFLLFQDIKEARHDIYHKVQMTKIEQNAICSQHLHCMHECENSCSSCEQYFFFIKGSLRITRKLGKIRDCFCCCSNMPLLLYVVFFLKKS